MSGSDSERGKANIFFPPSILDHKPNTLSRHNFEKTVAESGMGAAY